MLWMHALTMALHGSFTYQDARQLFFPCGFTQNPHRITYIKEEHMKSMNVFASLEHNGDTSLFFHKDHVIHEILWANDVEKPKSFRQLRLWHAYTFETPLNAQLYDVEDIEAWFL